MAIANTVIDYLESKRVKYSLINIVPVKTALEAARAATIAPDSLACATLVSVGGDQLMAVIPAGRTLDVWSLARRLKRDFSPATEQQIQTRFHDCGVRYLPPLGMAYGVPTVVDQTLTELEQVYFMAGDRSHLIQVDKKNFHRVFKDAVIGSRLTLDAAAAPAAAPNNTGRQNAVVSGDDKDDNEAALDIKERLRKTKKLPAMPGTNRTSRPWAALSSLIRVWRRRSCAMPRLPFLPIGARLTLCKRPYPGSWATTWS